MPLNSAWELRMDVVRVKEPKNFGKSSNAKFPVASAWRLPPSGSSTPSAVKAKEFSYYRIKFEQISRRRGKKRAVIAIARMILTAVFSMISTGEVWNPCDLYKVDMPEALKEKQKAKAIKQAVKFLEGQGLTVA